LYFLHRLYLPCFWAGVLDIGFARPYACDRTHRFFNWIDSAELNCFPLYLFASAVFALFLACVGLDSPVRDQTPAGAFWLPWLILLPCLVACIRGGTHFFSTANPTADVNSSFERPRQDLSKTLWVHGHIQRITTDIRPSKTLNLQFQWYTQRLLTDYFGVASG
jgi:hypothetical protein